MFIYVVRSVLFFIFIVIFVLGCGDSNPVESEEDHFEAIGFYAVFEEDTIVKYINGVVTGQFNLATGIISPMYQILFLEEDGDVGFPPTEEWSLGWEIEDNMVADIISDEADHDQYQIQFSGLKEGQTTIKIQIYHHDHKDYESEIVPIVVK